MIERFRNWMRAIRAERRERKLHNDRDVKCRYWWGDRGGYLLTGERCYFCNPRR